MSAAQENQDQEDYDVFPSLDARFHERLTKALREKFALEPVFITWEALKHLKPTLAAYKQQAEHLRGFVNKGDVHKLQKIAEQASKLSAAIAAAERAGLHEIIKDAASPVRRKYLDKILACIEERFSHDARETPFLKDTSRERLYANFERWWRQSAGLKADVEEGTREEPHPTPFMFVANEVFNLPGMPPPTGASYASLKKMRREVKARPKRLRDLGAALNRLSDLGPEQDEG